MAQVTAAVRAMNLKPGHEKAAVLGGADGALQRVPETRPASAAFELCPCVEQRLLAARANERARALFSVERAGAGALGAVLAQHLELLRVQRLLPLVLGMLDLEG